MPIRLVKPPNLEFRPAGSGYRFTDGTEMNRQSDNTFLLPDMHVHYLDALLDKGWKLWAPPKPKPSYASPEEREAAEHPIDVGAILKLALSEGVELRAEGGKLQKLTVAGMSRKLEARLKVRREAVCAELARRQACRWTDI
jgi:hypothetical protein